MQKYCSEQYTCLNTACKFNTTTSKTFAQLKELPTKLTIAHWKQLLYEISLWADFFDCHNEEYRANPGLIINYTLKSSGVIDLFVALEYSVQLHKCLVADSMDEATKKIKLIAEEFQKLEVWEKDGKIKVVDDLDKLGFKGVYVTDDSIVPEIRRMQVVTYQEIDLFYIQTDLYPEFFDVNGDLKGEDD
jgi:hypothetical protein